MKKISLMATSCVLAVFMTVLLLKVSISVAKNVLPPVQNEPLSNSLFGPFTVSAPEGYTASNLSCREGLVGGEPYLSTGIDIQQLGSGTYLDFSAHPPASQPSGMEYFEVIRIKQNKDSKGNYLSSYSISPVLSDTTGLGPIMASTPAGALWIIGNEPDRGPDAGYTVSGQDDTFPAIYARAYHDTYQFIKQHDPTAQVAIAGLVEVTPGRLQYLQIVWDTYASLYHEQMPVDVWNMHIYVLPEVNGIANVALGTSSSLAIVYGISHTVSGLDQYYTYGDHDKLSAFTTQVTRMRQWMKDHGQQDKPLLLSEFGLLFDEWVTDEFGNNFTSARATTFLTKTFNYLATATDDNLGMPSDNNRLVQQWAWFSANFSLGHIGNLVTTTVPLTFTSVGKMFRSSVVSRPLASNLLPRPVVAPALILAPGETSVTATLPVQIVNNGNRRVTAPLTVTFYSDYTLTQIIDSAVITGGVPGCVRQRVTANVEWPDLTVGFHSYWVKVDSTDAISETNEADNVIAGNVFVGTQGVYLPLIAKNSP